MRPQSRPMAPVTKPRFCSLLLVLAFSEKLLGGFFGRNRKSKKHEKKNTKKTQKTQNIRCYFVGLFWFVEFMTRFGKTLKTRTQLEFSPLWDPKLGVVCGCQGK